MNKHDEHTGSGWAVECDCGHCHGHNSPSGGVPEQDTGEREESHLLPLVRIGAGGILFVAGIITGVLVPPGTGFVAGGGLRLMLFILSCLVTGGTVLLTAVKNIFRGDIFDENFLMSVAAAGAFVIGEYPEAAAVMLFYQIGEFFQDYAVGKSRRSIQALMKLRPDGARIIRDGQPVWVDAESVSVGEIVEVRPGERIPVDGTVESGSGFIDTAALTGESVPRKVHPGDEVLGGSISTDGVLYIVTNKVPGESAIARILELVEHAGSKKSVSEQFITRFSRVYTPLVTIAAVLVAVVPPLVIPGAAWNTWISRALIFLVVSCPCALVLSVPLGFFGGIGAASRRGILVKGSCFLEKLSRTGTAVFDKTGTLTKGVFRVTAVHPAAGSGMTADELIAVAAHAEKYSSHPISVSLQAAHRQNACCTCTAQPDPDCACCSRVHLADVQEISGQGISAVMNGAAILVGNSILMKNRQITGFEQVSHGDPALTPEQCAAADGGTVVHIAENGIYAGHIVISDELKPGAAESLALLKQSGVNKTVMLTGDSAAAADRVAAELGLDAVYAELMPGDKVSKVEQLLVPDSVLLFVGDGINDAPVLARADVGIAMGAAGSDAAIEAADVVIMTDEISKVPEALAISRKTMGIVRQNIVCALGVKAAVMVLGAAGIASMWAAVFADVGVSVLAVLNAMRMLAGRYQNYPGSVAATGIMYS